MAHGAFHEQAAAFGPCEAGESFFCQGSATERMDPLEPFSPDPVIICYPCESHREATLTTRNIMEVLAA